MESYYKKILDEANQAGMVLILDTDSKYILVVKYWDSESGKVCGSRYPIGGNFKEGFLKFRRFFFDSTFDNIFLYVIKSGKMYRS